MKIPFFVTVLVFVISIAFYSMRKEGFGATSPGTMVQLSTSHVPTEEGAHFYKNVYPKMVRRDIIDMTGGDPGEIVFTPYGYYPFA